MPLHQLIFLMLTLAACCYAIARGGAPERVTAGGFLLAMILTAAADRAPLPYGAVEWQIALIDAALLATILFVALASCRFWALAMVSLMIIEMFGHLARLLDPDIVAKAYYALVALLSYPMIVLLVTATWRHRLRLRRYGVDYSWVWQLPPAYRLGWLAIPRKHGDIKP